MPLPKCCRKSNGSCLRKLLLRTLTCLTLGRPSGQAWPIRPVSCWTRPWCLSRAIGQHARYPCRVASKSFSVPQCKNRIVCRAGKSIIQMLLWGHQMTVGGSSSRYSAKAGGVVCHSFCLWAGQLTIKVTDVHLTNMVGVGKRWPCRSKWLLVLIKRWIYSHFSTSIKGTLRRRLTCIFSRSIKSLII